MLKYDIIHNLILLCLILDRNVTTLGIFLHIFTNSFHPSQTSISEICSVRFLRLQKFVVCPLFITTICSVPFFLIKFCSVRSLGLQMFCSVRFFRLQMFCSVRFLRLQMFVVSAFWDYNGLQSALLVSCNVLVFIFPPKMYIQDSMWEWARQWHLIMKQKDWAAEFKPIIDIM